MSDIDVGFYGNTLNWLLKKDVLNKESCFALNFGYKGQLPFPQFSMNLQTYLSKNMPIVTWYVDPESRRFRGSIDGPPPGLLQSKCFLVFIGGQYVDQLGEVMEKVKSVGKAVRMGAPYAVFIMKSVNTINLDPALFEGPKYSPEMNNHNKTGSNDPSIKETTLLPKNFAGPRHGQYVQPVLVIILLIVYSTTALTSYYLNCNITRSP